MPFAMLINKQSVKSIKKLLNKMNAFINADKLPKLDTSKVDSLIDAFNLSIRIIIGGGLSDRTISLNTTSDNVPKLSNDEFEKAQYLAIAMGWQLTRELINLDSTTYTLKTRNN
jgi:hypothetical protein